LSNEQFRRFAAEAELVPVWRDCLLDTDTPVSAFAKLRRGPFAFLLESAPAGGETWSRYTFMGTEPRSAWRLKAGTVEDWNAERGWHNPRRPADPLADLATLVDAAKPAHAPEVGQFWGGVVGFFSYDVVRVIEELPVRTKPSLGAPDALFVFTRSLVILDNLHGRARVVISVPVPRGARESQPKRPATSARSSSSTSNEFANTSGLETAFRFCSLGESTFHSTSIPPSSIERSAP
jgi:anthranilate synthase component I